MINDFWLYYQPKRPVVELPPGRWEQHFDNVKELHQALAPVTTVNETDPAAWDLLTAVEANLREFFRSNSGYGPLSRSVMTRVAQVSRQIRERWLEVERELGQFVQRVTGMSREEGEAADLIRAIAQLQEIVEQLKRDLKLRKESEALAKEVLDRWQTFLRLQSVVAVQRRYRPALQQLDRLRLNEQQEKFVAIDYQGAYRIQGSSGSGKTIILLHRALRLAAENPDSFVRVFTINRSLADLLRSILLAINQSIPANLHVAAFYDFLLDCVALFEPRDGFRLVDDLSGERVASISWHDFFNHKGKEETNNIFANQAVKDLIRSIEEREALTVDPCRYLRDEMVYIQSAFRLGERSEYSTAPRTERSISLQQPQRASYLRVLAAWEDWLDDGKLCDIDGLTLKAVEYFEDEGRLAQIRSAFPTDFVLADEVQDFSTLELKIARKLIRDPEGQNRFFLVGDLNQKVYAKHHDSVRSGFNFRGKAAVLSKNFRNTKEILRAAYRLPVEFPPKSEEKLEIGDPDYSIYEGGKPVALECTAKNHVERILDILQRRLPQRGSPSSARTSLCWRKSGAKPRIEAIAASNSSETGISTCGGSRKETPSRLRLWFREWRRSRGTSSTRSLPVTSPRMWSLTEAPLATNTGGRRRSSTALPHARPATS